MIAGLVLLVLVSLWSTIRGYELRGRTLIVYRLGRETHVELSGSTVAEFDQFVSYVPPAIIDAATSVGMPITSNVAVMVAPAILADCTRKLLSSTSIVKVNVSPALKSVKVSIINPGVVT